MEKNFIDKVDNLIEKHHLLNHSFYKAWSAGELPKETIREYAAQYFQHVSLFPRYLSAIHSNCDDIKTRQLLLENLNEEIIRYLSIKVKSFCETPTPMISEKDSKNNG